MKHMHGKMTAQRQTITEQRTVIHQGMLARNARLKTMGQAALILEALVIASCLISIPALAGGGLKGVKIFIDPGHGGPEPGAVGPSGLREADVNLRVSLALRNCLREYGGAQVMMSRTDNVDLGLGERVTAANNWGADRFISVHHNASVNRDYNATETYAYYYADKTATDMQKKVHNRLLEGLGLRDGQARTAGFYVLRNTSMPAILTEASYISNPYEEARLRDMGYTWREAYYIYLGIADHYGVAP